MRKYLLLLLLLLTGCGKNSNIEGVYDSNYYKVYSPYKESVGGYTKDSYDLKDVEKTLMQLSSNYFKTNNTYYQEGQYLTNDDLKYLLNDCLNQEDDYIKTIYEQNYLNNDGTLKGISLAIVLDYKIEYKEDGKIKTKTISDDELIKYAKGVAPDIIKYTREKIPNVRILLGIYIDSTDGKFVSFAVTSDEKLKFKDVNIESYSLSGNYVAKNDTDNYNYYIELKEALTDFDVYIDGKALYQDNKVNNITININTSYLTRGKLLYLTNLVSQNLKFNYSTKVYINYNNKTKALLVKEENTLEVKIYLMEE